VKEGLLGGKDLFAQSEGGGKIAQTMARQWNETSSWIEGWWVVLKVPQTVGFWGR